MAISVALFLIMAAHFNLYPIGKKSIAWCDMSQQAIPILTEYRDVLLGKSDLFISYANAGGMNFFALFLYYCASPFNLLLVFVKRQDISLFMNVLVMLKIAAASLTAFIYLHKKCGYKFNILNIALSVAYGFSGYVLMYYQLVSFLDCVYALPIFLLGLEAIDEGRSPILYAVTLAYSMLCSYYIAFMMVVYAVIRFGVGYLVGYKDKKRALNFVIGSLIAALLSAIVYIPVLLQYAHSARSGSIIDSLKNSPLKTTFHTAVLAVLGTALLIPMLLFKAEKKSERINRIMFLVTLVPVFLEPINKMWHTGTYMSFPSRYAFLTVFSAIAFVGERIGNYDGENKIKFFKSNKTASVITKIAVALAVALAVFGIVWFTIGFTTENYSVLSRYSSTLWSNDDALDRFLKFYGLILLLSIGLALLFRYKLVGKLVLGLAIFALVINDAVFTFNIHAVNPSHEVTNFQKMMDMGEIIKDEDFFRVKETSKLFSGSDGIGINAIGAMGYNSMAHYTSLTDKDYMSAIKKLGYSSYWMEVADYGGSTFSDAFMINRYTLKKNDPTDPAAISQNPVLPFGVVTSGEISAAFEGERSDALETLYTAVTGKSGLVTKYPLDDADVYDVTVSINDGVYDFKLEDGARGRIVYDIDVVGKQRLYFDCFDLDTVALNQHINESFSVRVNGARIASSYPTQSRNGILDLGTFENRSVQIEIGVTKNVYAASFGIFGEDLDAVEDAIGNAVGADLTVSGNKIKGFVSASDGDKLLIALTYDEGFSFRVNGKRVKAEKVLTDFIAIPLTDGDNEITATFVPRGFVSGIIIFFLGVAAAVLFSIFGLKKILPTERAQSVAETIAFFGALALSAVVFAAVYIAPMILCIF